MKVTRFRKYQVNLGNYESVSFGATVEVEDHPAVGVADLDSVLDSLLAKEIARAKEITDEESSFILTKEFHQTMKEK